MINNEISNIGKKFIKSFAVIGTGTFLNMLIGLVTTPIITRIVNPIEYGQLSIFTMYSTIGVMVFCLGLDQALIRFYYDHTEYSYKRNLLFRCIFLPIIISFCCFLICLICSYLRIFEFEFNIQTQILLCVNIFTQLIYRFSLLLVRLESNSKLYSILQVLQKISYVGFALFLINIVKKDFFFILAFSTTLSFIICLTISLLFQRNIWMKEKKQEKYIPIPTSELLRYGLPFIFSMGITTLFQATDKIFLNFYCTYKEVGIYSSTLSIVHIFSLVQSTFNTLWAPTAMEHYKKNSEEKSLYEKANQIITVIMFAIGITLILLKDFFSLLLGDEYREAAFILPCLIFNPIMYTISETTVNGLVFAKKSGMQVLVAIGACCTNIVANIVLVPVLGSRGAAISNAISYIVFFALRTFLSNKYYYVNYKLKKFSLITLLVFLYAIYNTFISFNFLSIVGYFICLFFLFVLYNDSIKQFVSFMYKLLKKGV